MAPAAPEASELNGHARAGVRWSRARSQLLQVNDLHRHAAQLAGEAFDVALADDRDHVPLRLGQASKRTGHERVPVVDQNAFRGRELVRELLEESLLVLVESLEFRLDLLLSGEQAAQGGHQEPHALS